MTTPAGPRPMSFGRGSVATKNRLTLSDTITFDEWKAIGAQIANLTDASAWWLGDWLFYGQWQYGSKYIIAAEITGYDEGHLRNYSSVAGRFNLSERSDKLSFTHHAYVVSLPIDEARQWLARAAAEGWSTRQLREEVREAKAKAAPPAPLGPPDAAIPSESIIAAADADVPEQVTFRASGARFRRWSAAAAASGRTITDWAIATLDAAAKAAA